MRSNRTWSPNAADTLTDELTESTLLAARHRRPRGTRAVDDLADIVYDSGVQL